MELHQLRYVLAVARTGNFSRAAEQCHVSRPSLSQQIQKLEDELSERLFDRLKTRARLTPAALRYYRSLAEPVPQRTIVAAWLGTRPPGRAASAFLRHLREVAVRVKATLGSAR